MAEKQILSPKPAPRLEQVGDEHSERVQDRKHRSQGCDDSALQCESRPDEIFGKDSCGLGALTAAAYEITRDHRRTQDLAINALRPTCGSSTLVNINDMRGHAAVLALFDEVLAAM